MNSSKKRTNEFVFTTLRRVFVPFLEEIEDSKKAFRNYLTFRARPDWVYEFPDQTGPDTQIFKHFTYQV